MVLKKCLKNPECFHKIDYIHDVYLKQTPTAPERRRMPESSGTIDADCSSPRIDVRVGLRAPLCPVCVRDRVFSLPPPPPPPPPPPQTGVPPVLGNVLLLRDHWGR